MQSDDWGETMIQAASDRRKSLCAVLVGAVIVLASSVGAAAGVEIIAHRGASHDAPENTLAAVNLAWQRDADAVEIDVFLSKDGRIVAMHDETTGRTTGNEEKVAAQTLRELKSLDAGRWKGERWAGEKIPTLAEILRTVPPGKRLFIEVKCGPEIVPELGRVLKGAGKKPEQAVIISFSKDVVTAAKARFPELSVYWLVGLKQDEETGQWSFETNDLIEQTRTAAVDGINVNSVPVVDREFVASFKQAGFKVYVWTVNSPEEARRLVEAGVDGITTDRPRFLRLSLPDVQAVGRKAAAIESK